MEKLSFFCCFLSAVYEALIYKNNADKQVDEMSLFTLQVIQIKKGKLYQVQLCPALLTALPQREECILNYSCVDIFRNLCTLPYVYL